MEGQIVFWSGGSYDTQQFIDALLPLSLFVNAQGMITGSSASMRKSIPAMRGRVYFDDLLDVERPNGFQELLALDDTSYFVIIVDKRNGNRFKCTKLQGSKGIFMLVCNPMINENNTPANYNLEVSDFAPHDIIAEYLFVMRANKMGILEANQLIDDMSEKNKQLEMARKDLLALNTRLEEKAERTGETLRLAQSGLLEGEKLALLGRLSAGIAHEMNTPLGAIAASVDNVSEILKKLFKEGLKNADHSTVMAACGIADEFTAHDTLTSREEREEIKRLTQHLSTVYNVGEIAATHARKLVECGVISSDTDVLEHIYTSENVESALEMTTIIMKVRKSISTIEVAAQKAANVVKALKSYVHTNNSLEVKAFNVNRSIREILLLFNSQLRQGVEVHLDMEDPLLIEGNESEVSKIWSNLIANSLYAMQNSGNLWITGRSDKHNVIITVTNDGPPIPEEVQARLFEPFYTTKPIGEGSGMGLSIVINIVAAMNGSVEFESSDTTTFTVTIPNGSNNK